MMEKCALGWHFITNVIPVSETLNINFFPFENTCVSRKKKRKKISDKVLFIMSIFVAIYVCKAYFL